MQKIAFFDRDGVINIEKDYLYKIEDFEFIDGVFDTFKYLLNLQYKIVIITNQSGIGRGYYTKNDFDKLTSWMLKQFENNDIQIQSVHCCPHTPDDGCDCRKPKTGMIKQASKLIKIDYKNSWLIGDKDSDIKTAINSNIPNTIQVLSGHKFDQEKSQASFIIKSVKDIPNIIKS